MWLSRLLVSVYFCVDPKLYAGRCAVNMKGGILQLRVGEREYFSYTSADPRGINAIKEFNQYVSLYKRPHHNGIVLPSRSPWLAQLESCVEYYQDLDEVVLISRTMSKLRSLIMPSLRRGLLVKIYTRHPEFLSTEERYRVELLAQEIRRDVRDDNDPCHGGRVEIRRYRHPSTFRAALIGQEVLGVQMYVHRVHWEAALEKPPMADVKSQPPRSDDMKPSDLRVIVTRHSAQFETLRKGLIEQFLRCQGVDELPVERVP